MNHTQASLLLRWFWRQLTSSGIIICRCHVRQHRKYTCHSTAFMCRNPNPYSSFWYLSPPQSSLQGYHTVDHVFGCECPVLLSLVIWFSYFDRQMIKYLQSIITYFWKSHVATDALNRAHKSMNIERGLEGIGKTHFVTICILALSLKRCFPALCQIVDAHLIKFPPHKLQLTGLLMSNLPCSLEFESYITCYTNIVAPIAKLIAYLESSQTDLLDLDLYYFAIGATLK